MSAERKKTLEELDAELDAFLAKPCPPPSRKKKRWELAIDHGKPVADTVVKVGPTDPNYPRSDNGVVRVRTDLVPGFDADGRPAYPTRQAITAYNPFSRERMGFND
jgi:hypothetical protein